MVRATYSPIAIGSSDETKIHSFLVESLGLLRPLRMYLTSENMETFLPVENCRINSSFSTGDSRAREICALNGNEKEIEPDRMEIRWKT